MSANQAVAWARSSWVEPEARATCIQAEARSEALSSADPVDMVRNESMSAVVSRKVRG